MPMQNNRGGGDLAPAHSLPWLQKCLNGLRNVSVAFRSGKTQYPLYRGAGRASWSVWMGIKSLSHPGSIRSPDCPARCDYTIPAVRFLVHETNFNPKMEAKISSETYDISYTVWERRRALSEQHLLFLCAPNPKSILLMLEADNSSEMSQSAYTTRSKYYKYHNFIGIFLTLVSDSFFQLLAHVSDWSFPQFSLLYKV